MLFRSEQIKEIDNDDRMYHAMLEQPAMLRFNYIEDLKINLERFLVNIFEQPVERARRRSSEPMVRAYYEEKKVEQKKQNFVSLFLNSQKKI